MVSSRSSCSEFGSHIVLFCPSEHAWKITDFGLTSEGTSMTGYDTRSGRGTEGDRAPEIMSRDGGIVSKQSDIFALGCILYELISGQKAFVSDFDVYNYADKREPPTIPSLEVDCRIAGSVRQLTYAMIQVDWELRPSASDILRALRGLNDAFSDVYIPRT